MNPNPPVTRHTAPCSDAVVGSTDATESTGKHARSCEVVAVWFAELKDSSSVDADEYRRMADAGERHWWYRSTRQLLQDLVEPHLDRGASALCLDAGGGTGATGGWLTTSAATVLGDYEITALEVGRADFAGYLPVRMDLNQVPFADRSFSAVLCVTALCHRPRS